MSNIFLVRLGRGGVNIIFKKSFRFLFQIIGASDRIFYINQKEEIYYQIVDYFERIVESACKNDYTTLFNSCAEKI